MGVCKSLPCYKSEFITGAPMIKQLTPAKFNNTQSTIDRKQSSDSSSDRHFDTARTDTSLKIHRSNFVHVTQGKISDFYRLEEILGDGSYGRVYRALHLGTESYRAIKAVSKRNFSKNDQDNLIKEVEILKSLDHPNILKIFEVIEDNLCFYIVTELCTGGELFDKIVSQGHISENEAASYMYQLLSALSYCYKNGIVHRDLKPENLMLRDREPDAPLKLIDFGTSRRINSDQKLKSIIGSAYYIAPEVIEGNYDAKCDVWSTGVILYTMMCGSPPFNGSSDREIMTKISRGVYTFSNPE